MKQNIWKLINNQNLMESVNEIMFVRYFLLLNFAFCKDVFDENDTFDRYSDCP